MPKDIDDGARVNSAGSGISQWEMGSDRREDGKLNYQERVAMIWIEKVKAMGSCALNGVERGRGCAEDRVILTEMSNIGMFKRVNKAVSNPPVKVISPDVRTLGNGDSNRQGMIGVFRHTLGRKDSC